MSNHVDPADQICFRWNGRAGHCGRPLHEHVGDEQLCPDAPPTMRGGRPRTFKRHTGSVSRASLSLSESDATVLAEICKRALAGGDVAAFARLNAGVVGRLLAIARSVKARVEAQRAAVKSAETEAVSGVHERVGEERAAAE